jgi:hypothetical protein
MFTRLSMTFPHELHAGGSLLFLASSPRNEAIHLPSRSIEMEIKLTRHQMQCTLGCGCLLLAEPTRAI